MYVGWDAYCTGLVFASELQMLRASVDELRPLAGNKMFMMQSMYTMDLDPARPSSILKVRGVVFYLYDFPASTGVPDILAVFTALGHRKEDIDLTWVDGTSTLVTIAGPMPAPEGDIVRVYSTQLRSPWKIETLAQFRARSVSTPVANPKVPVTATTTATATNATSSSGLWSWVNYLTSPFTGSSSEQNSLHVGGKKRKL